MEEGGDRPSCFPDDLECQSVSKSRERIYAGIIFGITGVIIIFLLVAYCFFKRKAVRKTQEKLNPNPTVMVADYLKATETSQ